jgi:hypothetical protein
MDHFINPADAAVFGLTDELTRSDDRRAVVADYDLTCSARLMQVIAEANFGYFDQYYISGRAFDDPAMLCALGFLSPKRRRGLRMLSHASLQRVSTWIEWAEGRNLSGLVLRRDAIGWCRIEEVCPDLDAGKAAILKEAERKAEIKKERKAG